MNTILTILAFICASLFVFSLLDLGISILKKKKLGNAGQITTFPLIRGDGGVPKKLDAPTAPKKIFKPSKRGVPATLIGNGKKATFLSSSGKLLRAKVVNISNEGKIVWLRRRGSIEFQRNLAA